MNAFPTGKLVWARRGGLFLAAAVLVSMVWMNAGPVSIQAEGRRPPVITVWVNDRQVPVIEHWVGGHLNCTYAPLTLPGSANVEVEVPGGIRHWSVSPVKCGVPVTVEGNRLKFPMLTSRYLVMMVNGMRLLLLADPPEDALPEGKPVFDLSAPPYNVDRSGTRDCTQVLQKACDDAGEQPGGAVVVLPPGLYTTTGIRLRSRTQLYLAPGAVLQGNDKPEAYPDHPALPGKTACAALVRVDGVEHVRIFGRGTLDARGSVLAGDAANRDEPRLLAGCVSVERSRCVSVEGIICKESTTVALRFYHSQDVAVSRVKVINDLASSDPVDGIRFAATQRGLVEDCLVHTTEDAYAVAGSEGTPTEQMVLRRLIAISGARALRCGPEAFESLQRIRFEDVDVLHSRDAIVLLHGRGKGDWEEITFKDIRVEDCGRNSINISLLDGGSIRNVRFENVLFAKGRPGYIRGLDASSQVQEVTFAGLEVEGHSAMSPAAAGIRVGGYVGEIRFDDW